MMKTDDDHKLLVQGIKLAMQEKGYSQADVGRLCGFNRAFLSDLFSGKKKKIRAAPLEKLAQSLETSVDDLKHGKGVMPEWRRRSLRNPFVRTEKEYHAFVLKQRQTVLVETDEDRIRIREEIEEGEERQRLEMELARREFKGFSLQNSPSLISPLDAISPISETTPRGRVPVYHEPIFNSQICFEVDKYSVQTQARPAGTFGVQGVFGIRIQSEFNSPRLSIGDTVFVKPLTSLKTGQLVVAIKVDGAVLNFAIANLVSCMTVGIVLQHINSGELVKFSPKDITAIYPVCAIHL